MPTGELPAPASDSVERSELEVTRGRASRVIERLAIATLAALLFAFVWEGAPNYPVWDAWVWIIQARAFHEGGFAGFWSTDPFLFFDHVYALPSLFVLLFGPLVGYSFRALALVSAALVFALGLTFWRLARKEGLGWVAGLAVLSAVVSPRHYENLLLGFQLGLSACVLFGSLAVIVADERRDRSGLVLASALALCSAASSSAGLLACAAVVLVRGFAPRLQRLWILAAFAGILVVTHFGLVALHRPSFVGAFLAQVAWSNVPHFLEYTVKGAGAGLLPGPVALPVGLVLIAGSLTFAVSRIRRTKRIDALVGLTIFSLSACFVIAVSRPRDGPAFTSRHALFAAPLVAVFAILCLQWLRRTASVRVLGYSIVFVGLAYCSWVNFVDAGPYRRTVQMLNLGTEFTIAVSAHGGTLTTDETDWLTGTLTPGKPARTSGRPEEARALVQFVVDRGYCGSGRQTFDLEHHEELPSLIHGATNVRTEQGIIRFAGGGHVYNEYSCSESSGRLIRMSAEVSTVGTATVGIIVLRPDGSERTHASVAVSRRGEFAPVVVRDRARPGDRIQLYVYAGETDKEVAVRSFQVDMVDAPFEPEPH